MNLDQVSPVYRSEILTEEGQRRRRERIHWLVENARGESVLDMSCGEGMVCILLGRKGFTCVGVDSSPTQIDQARRSLEREDPATRARVNFDVLESRDTLSGRYDTIIFGEALAGARDPAGLVDSFLPTLNEGGRILVAVSYGYYPATDHHHPFYMEGLFGLLSERMRVDDLRLIDRELFAIASREDGPHVFEFDRSSVGTIETMLAELHQEIHELKTKVDMKSNEVQAAEMRARAKADEIVLLKEKHKSRLDELQLVKSKLKERAEDIRLLKERLAKYQTRAKVPRRVTAVRVARRWVARRTRRPKRSSGS